MKHFVFAFFLFIWFSDYAQEADTLLVRLEHQVQHASTDSVAIDAQIALADYVRKFDIGKARNHIEQAIGLIESKGSGSDYFLRREADAHNYLGIFDNRQGNLQGALKNHLKALKIRERLADSAGIGQSNHNLGMFYRRKQQYEKAKPYFWKAIDIRSALGDNKRLAASHNMLGGLHHYDKKLDSALYHYNRSKSLDTSQSRTTRVNVNMGALYFSNEKYEAAINIYLESLGIFERVNNQNEISVVSYSLGQSYMQLGAYKPAQKYFNKALEASKKLGNRQLIIKQYEARSRLYELMGKPQKALIDHRLFKAHSDTLNNLETAKQITEIELTHEFAQEKIADSLRARQEKAVLAQTLKSQRATSFRNYLIAFFVLVITILLVIYNRKRLALSNLEKKVLQEELVVTEDKLNLKEEQVNDLLTESLLHIEKKHSVLTELKNLDASDASKSLKSIIAELQADKVEESNRILIRKNLVQKDTYFLSALKRQHPMLTDLELELCAFIHLNLTRSEIATLRGNTINTVKKSRQRLRKKLELTAQTSLEDFLNAFIIK